MSNIDKARQWLKENEHAVGSTIELIIIEDERPVSAVKLPPAILMYAVTTPIKWYTYWSKTVIGYYRNGMFYINRRNNLSVSKTVEFLVHEACHRAGLKHDAIKWYKRNRKEVENSLVYRIGREIGGMYEG